MEEIGSPHVNAGAFSKMAGLREEVGGVPVTLSLTNTVVPIMSGNGKTTTTGMERKDQMKKRKRDKQAQAKAAAGQEDDPTERDVTLATLPVLEEGERPQKKFYRSRAHCNPFSHNDLQNYPVDPVKMDWSKHYPNVKDPTVEVIDVGCGFGGLTVELSKLLPDTMVLGMEIRPKVTEYVRLRLENLRKENPGQFENGSVIKTNAMKYLPNFFKKGQLKTMFFCFPDPQFKRKNHRRRIVNYSLLSEYAYNLELGGILYTITDVKELHDWHVEKCSAHPMFERIPEDAMSEDEKKLYDVMHNVTEESMKVERSGCSKYAAAFRRVEHQCQAKVVGAANDGDKQASSSSTTDATPSSWFWDINKDPETAAPVAKTPVPAAKGETKKE